MSKDLILSIDHGTQSVRALAFDLSGNILAKSQVPIEPYFSVSPGFAEQYPHIFWQAVCDACQELWAENIKIKDRIAGVGLTTQRSTIINLDAEGKPLRPAIVWLDQRRTNGLPAVGGLWGIAFKIAGMSNTVAYLQAEAEANWIRVHQPDIWEKTRHLLFLSGYLTYQLTQRYVDSIGCQVGYVPFDYKNFRWASNFDWKWQAVPLSKEILPDLVHPTEILGEITKEAAIKTGIPEGLPLIATASDKACEVLGAGCLDPSIGCLGYGTSATINTTHKRYIEVIPLIPPYPSAIPGYYSLEHQIYRGYWLVSWFKQEFAYHEVELSTQRGMQPEQLLDELIQTVPPGSDGLILQPFWSPGLKYPGPEARGTVIGFTGNHTRAHLYRAILEGVAYALREGAEKTIKRTGVPIKQLRVAGGGSQSKVALQLTADIFGLPTAKPHTFEASGLGAAIDVAVGMNLHNDFSTAILEMTRQAEWYEPDPANHSIYNQIYNHAYKKIYNRLHPIYNSLIEIVQQSA